MGDRITGLHLRTPAGACKFFEVPFLCGDRVAGKECSDDVREVLARFGNAGFCVGRKVVWIDCSHETLQLLRAAEWLERFVREIQLDAIAASAMGLTNFERLVSFRFDIRITCRTENPCVSSTQRPGLASV